MLLYLPSLNGCTCMLDPMCIQGPFVCLELELFNHQT